jgi:hypothetical protein
MMLQTMSLRIRYLLSIFYLAPHANYNGHKECFYERVAGMDGVELPGQVLMNDSAE